MKAIIFDMDGTLVDSMHMHFLGSKKIFEKYNIEFTPEDTQKYAGIPVKHIIKEKLPHLSDEQIQEMMQEKMQFILNNMDEYAKPMPGAYELLEDLKQAGYKLAIASGTRQQIVNDCVKKLGFEKYLDCYLSSDLVSQGKPQPDIFLEVAKRLDVSAQNCWVIEDGESGMIGAKKAGMSVIGISDKNTIPADIIVKELKDITVAHFT
ncbi:MAG: HAD family hydrolase [Candidatus Woesearchaeota archaeon]